MDQLTTNVRNQQWLQMVQDQKSSGLTVKDWCLENHISENCFYYRQHKLRMSAAGLVSQFVEVKQQPAAEHHENFIHNSAARISAGNLAIDLFNQASEELISRIVRVLNAQ